MKLGKIVTNPGLEYVSLCGNILCSLCMISGFGVKGGHVVATGCIFSWCALSATVSVEGKAWSAWSQSWIWTGDCPRLNGGSGAGAQEAGTWTLRVGLLPNVIVSVFIEGMARIWGLKPALLNSFHLFHSVCTLVRGRVELGSVVAPLLSCLHFFPSVFIHVCVGSGRLCQGQRQSQELNCLCFLTGAHMCTHTCTYTHTHTHTHTGSGCLPYPEAGLRPQLALFPLGTHVHRQWPSLP